MMLAQTVTTGATNNEIGLFVVCAAVVFGMVGALISVASYFATRREVDDLKERVQGIEELMEERTEKLHKRINRLLAGQMLIAGQVGVALENHSTQLEALMQQLESEED
jgi:phosphate/sulfate permease